MTRFFTASFFLIILFSSCTAIRNTSNTTPATEPLFLSKWTLSELNGKPVDADPKPYMIFTAGDVFRVSGYAGCNLMSGTFTLSGADSIDFGVITSTMMACPDYDTEQSFLNILSMATNWYINNGVLILMSDATTLAKFSGSTVSVLEEAENMAANGTWELSYISGPRVPFETLYPTEKPSLIISMPNTKASGSSGCNTFTADVKIKDNTMLFGPIASTKMYCEGIGESTYFETLAKITTWQMDGNNDLALMIGDVVMMRFVRK